MAGADVTTGGYEALIGRLCGQGLADQRTAEAMRRYPRVRFIPGRIWASPQGGGPMAEIDRATDPDGWQAVVEADTPVVTQLDDHGYPSSSSSMPTMVAEMISHLDVREGHRVLEVGAGTGWNAALLTRLVGPHGSVTSMEIDADVADHARKRLADAGADTLVITGDGERGFPGELYDRVICTCAVHLVPETWAWQARPGGIIVTPWLSPFSRQGLLLRLTTGGRGEAAGRFVGWASFIMSRRQRQPTGDVPVPDTGGTTRQSENHPGLALNDDAEITAGFLVPSCQWWREDRDDGAYARLDDPVSGSWALVGPVTESGTCPVRQGGPRALWDEVEAAYQWWLEVGEPEHTRFGLSIADGWQWVWLDEPSRLVASITAPRHQ